MAGQLFFKFRQTSPPPPGKWVTCGPFDTYDQATAERNRSYAWDAEVGPVFSASSLEEAQSLDEFGHSQIN
ncbi:hypothetical protein V5F40_22815 [Xanthobacter sp. DSM 14520]|uniref:hypothetical protein n=1 Tax=Xanthobacter autotrophicus (strain ATCC BAA-1158 / Py2) TaxID=78245 RepID=UPI00372BC7D4